MKKISTSQYDGKCESTGFSLMKDKLKSNSVPINEIDPSTSLKIS